MATRRNQEEMSQRDCPGPELASWTGSDLLPMMTDTELLETADSVWNAGVRCPNIHGYNEEQALLNGIIFEMRHRDIPTDHYETREVRVRPNPNPTSSPRHARVWEGEVKELEE